MPDIRDRLPKGPQKPERKRTSKRVRRIVLELLADMDVSEERIADQDLANLAGLSAVSVNYAINDLAGDGLIEVTGHTAKRAITVTKQGRKVAEGHDELA